MQITLKQHTVLNAYYSETEEMTVFLTEVQGDKSFVREFKFPKAELFGKWRTYMSTIVTFDFTNEPLNYKMKTVSREDEEKDFILRFLSYLKIGNFHKQYELSVPIYSPALFVDFLMKRGWVSFDKFAEADDPHFFVRR